MSSMRPGTLRQSPDASECAEHSLRYLRDVRLLAGEQGLHRASCVPTPHPSATAADHTLYAHLYQAHGGSLVEVWY